MDRASAEWRLLHGFIAAIYEAGGNLDEDDRLGDCIRALLAPLERLGHKFDWDYGDLREIRARVKAGERLAR